MENNKIILKLSEQITINLSSDTPDMQTMINKIVEYRDVIKQENIKVIVPDESNFDKEGFEEMIKNVIHDYLKTLKLEQMNYEQAQK